MFVASMMLIGAGTPRGLGAQAKVRTQLSDGQRQDLLAVRDSVWRSFYTNDQDRMKLLVPANLIAINPGDSAWQSRPAFLAAAATLAQHHARLISLDFPRTEIQVFGPVAVLYSLYRVRVEVDGKEQTQAGRATEIFVREAGRWRNPGWHLDSGT